LQPMTQHHNPATWYLQHHCEYPKSRTDWVVFWSINTLSVNGIVTYGLEADFEGEFGMVMALC
jgi:hypothetical protein